MLAVRPLSALFVLGLLAAPARACEPDPVSWDVARDKVKVEAIFDGVGKLELTVTRQPGVAGDLLVTFPAGTYGRPHGVQPRTYQDLVFLRAPEARLGRGEEVTRLSVPIACGSYGVSTPPRRFAFDLQRFEKDSPMEKLLAVLCAGPHAPAPDDAQLAVWIVRNDLRALRGWETTFGEVEQPITFTDSGAGASRMITEAGLQPSTFPFFAERSTQAKVKEQVKPEPPTATP